MTEEKAVRAEYAGVSGAIVGFEGQWMGHAPDSESQSRLIGPAANRARGLDQASQSPSRFEFSLLTCRTPHAGDM